MREICSIKKMKLYISSLKIKHKLLAILSVQALVISLISMLVLHISFYIYDGQLYKESAEALNLSTIIAESKLKTIQKLSYDIYSNAKVQEYLKLIKYGTDSYEKQVAVNNLLELLTSWSLSENYILSIHIIDTYGDDHSSGIRVIKIENTRKNEIIELSKDKNGKIVWVDNRGEDKAIIMAREVRSYDNLSLEDLGTLVIRMDNKKLIEKPSNILGEFNTYAAVISKDNIVFSNSKLDLEKLGFKLNGKEGYRIISINGMKYLAAYVSSGYTDWKYVNIVSYEEIFKKTTTVRSIMIVIDILVFGLVLLIGMRFVKGITKPIENLSVKMKIVENGQFLIEPSNDYNQDEIGRLSNDFDIMIKKINFLIEEDYKKQILLKETEIAMLQGQINPHFLYNTLESINWLAKINKQEKISIMIKSLGDLLRNSISNKKNVITLGEEILILNDYVTIQKMRFGQRLDIKIDIKPELMDCKIPKLTLQPIVENSINYSLENIGGICEIRVGAKSMEGEYLEINVIDNGIGMNPDLLEKVRHGEVKKHGSGIGLKNINDRIKGIFGAQYGILIFSELNKGTRISVKIPFTKE